MLHWDFPSGPMAKTQLSPYRGPGSTPGQGTRSHMPQLSLHAIAKEPTSCN